MPRARSPNRDKAERLWLESNKSRPLKDIATELGVSESQVRKWKCEDKWETKTLRIVNGNCVVSVTKTKGGQINNKNAVGSGAPLGNSNAVSTGEFESIFFDTLDDDERILIDKINIEKKAMLKSEIQLLTVRERRMLKRIDKFKQYECQTAEITTEFDTILFIQKVKSKSKLAIIQSIEESLTRIQAQKRQYIELLDKIERGELEAW